MSGCSVTEAVVLAEAGREAGDDGDDDDRTDAAADDGDGGAEGGVIGAIEEGSDCSGLEAAEFVGGSDEETVDGLNAAAHVVGGEELDEGMSNDDGDHVDGSQENEHQEREGEGAGETEDDGEDSESDNRPEEGFSGALHPTVTGEIEGHEKRSDGGTGAHQAEGEGADLQDFPLVDGK